MKNCLSIAGSDCSGGAGIQADIKTFSANGCFGMSVVTSVVAENTNRVISVQDIDLKIIEDQIDAVFEDIQVDAVKIGMLSSESVMRTVTSSLDKYRPEKIVIDPVMIAKGGCALMKPEALETLKSKIIPMAYILTPNIPEAETITGMKIESVADMKKAAKEIHLMGASNILIKGGHMSLEVNRDAVDVLFDGKDFYEYINKRINTKNTHGTGCTLSSAIAANLANGLLAREAVGRAKEYVTEAIKNALDIGKGHGPTNHFYELYKIKGIT